MKIAVCFFGNFLYLDSLMIQSWMKNIILPLQRYGGEDIEFMYYIHSSLQTGMKYIEMMLENVPFQEVRLHRFDDVNHFSHRQIADMWSSSSTRFHLVIYIRVDTFMTRTISQSEIDLMMSSDQSRKIFVPYDHSRGIESCIIMGSPDVMKIYDGDNLFNFCHTHKIDLVRIFSFILVRIASDGKVYDKDVRICPYLSDLINPAISRIFLPPESV